METQQTEMSIKLYVGNLSSHLTNFDLIKLFGQVAPVCSADVILDRLTGRSRGFGFVEMNSPGHAEEAIAKLNGHDVQGRRIKVAMSKPREAAPDFDGGRFAGSHNSR